MKKIWNVSPLGLMVDYTKRAVLPCESVMVADALAEQLVDGGSFSYENPRRPPVKRTQNDGK